MVHDKRLLSNTFICTSTIPAIQSVIRCECYCVLLIGCACYCPLWTFMPMLYDM